MNALAATLVLPAGTLWRREVVRFFRQPNRIVGSIGTPVVFWALIGSGLGGSFRPPSYAGGRPYLLYLVPGTAILIVLFAAIFSTISIIEDRREGFLQGVLVAPVSRSAIVLGKVLGGATIALVHGAAFLLLAPLAGVPLSLASEAGAAGVLLLVALGLTGLGFAIAWRMDSTQGFHAIMNLFLMPLWLLSGAFFPAEGAPGWLRAGMAANPLTYGVAALRHVLTPDDPSIGHDPSIGVSLAVTALFAAAAFALCVALARRPLPGGGSR